MDYTDHKYLKLSSLKPLQAYAIFLKQIAVYIKKYRSKSTAQQKRNKLQTTQTKHAISLLKCFRLLTLWLHLNFLFVILFIWLFRYAPLNILDLIEMNQMKSQQHCILGIAYKVLITITASLISLKFNFIFY